MITEFEKRDYEFSKNFNQIFIRNKSTDFSIYLIWFNIISDDFESRFEDFTVVKLLHELAKKPNMINFEELEFISEPFNIGLKNLKQPKIFFLVKVFY